MFRKFKFIDLLVLCLIFGLTFALFISVGSAEEKSVLDSVLDRGKLIVATFSDTSPAGFLNEKNELIGIDVDIANLMAKELGVELELVITTNANRIPYLLTGKVDCVIAAFSINAERSKVVEFSDPYFIAGSILITNTKNPTSAEIKGIQDLKGKNICVSKGSFNDVLATELVGRDANIIRFDNVSDIYQALKIGKADVVIEEAVLAGYNIKTHYPDFKLVGDLLNADPWGIGVQRGDQIWLNWINGFVYRLLTSGDMKNICENYNVPYKKVNYEY